MTILVTGAAGFIGAHTTKALLDRGHTVLGVDNFNDYYSPHYKRERMERLIGAGKVINADITDEKNLKNIFKRQKFDRVCHLAAQAGVRYSFENPHIYEEINVLGTLNLLEFCRKYGIEHFIFASSSSVYGANKKLPFSEEDPVWKQISIYGATKSACEHFAHVYHSQFGIKCVGLRFFTVYGPWGRPDMAYFRFARSMGRGESIEVYGEGKMKRDFTYIDDIVSGTVAAVELDIEYEIINLGNSNTVELEYFISLIEKELGMKAKKEYKPMQPGDLRETYADITKAKKILNFDPKTSIEQGIEKFIGWFIENDKMLKKLKVI